jgi:hypothetical protein
LFLALVLLASPLYAQQPETTLKYSHSIPIGSPTTIAADRNGNIYLLDPSHNLLRLDSLGLPRATFSPPTRGRISTVDASNPLKLLLFYQDRQSLLLLDRFLHPIGDITLTDYTYTGNAGAAALTSDDGIWLFKETDFTLGKLDLRLRKMVVETPLNLILDRERFQVTGLREYQNMVYLLDVNGGIYVFDNLGNYKQKLPFSGIAHMGFIGNELYFIKDGNLHFYDLYKLRERVLPLPKPNIYRTALVGKNHLYLFTGKAMDVYTLR